jgi:hypothetical protein
MKPVAGRRDDRAPCDLIRRAKTTLLQLLHLPRVCGFGASGTGCRQIRNEGMGFVNRVWDAALPA